MMGSPAGRAATVSTGCASRRRVAPAGSARPVASTTARPMMARLTHSGMVARLIRDQRAIEDHTGTKKAKICPDWSHALSNVSMNMPDPAERALALQDTIERAIEGPDHHAGACCESGDHGEEAYLVHGAPEAAEPASDKIADETGAEPQAHHRRDHAGRRDLRNERQANGGEIELADGDDDEIGKQPPPRRQIA